MMRSGARERRSLPRFERTGPGPRLSLTPEDDAILRHIERHRFLSTALVYRLLAPRSPDKISRRLAALYRAGLLDRPRSQIDAYRGGGSQPLVYGLDNAGARRLAYLRGESEPHGDLRSRNHRYTRENLDHTLAVASFLVGIELACRTHDDFDYIAPEEAHARSAQWSVSLPWQGHRAEVRLAPDAVFGLRKHEAGGNSRRTFFFVEVDRGSMTIVPSRASRSSDAFLFRSSVLRKLLAYAVSHRERAYESLGLPTARVLFVTTSPARAEAMRNATHSLVAPHLEIPTGLFLFGALGTQTDPLTSPYRAIDGREVTLAPT